MNVLATKLDDVLTVRPSGGVRKLIDILNLRINVAIRRQSDKSTVEGELRKGQHRSRRPLTKCYSLIRQSRFADPSWVPGVNQASCHILAAIVRRLVQSCTVRL